VLALLLLYRNTPVPTARIVQAVWGEEPPQDGANVVQKYVAGLRRELEPQRPSRAPGHLLTLGDAGYTLAVAAEQVDVDVFDRLRRSGFRHREAGRPEQALGNPTRGGRAGLRGTALRAAGPWFAAARERLQQEWLDALEACVELDVTLGRHEDALPEIRQLVSRFPLRERLHGTLMLALYRGGRPAEALAAFQQARTRLAQTLGADPGPDLQELNRRILVADPALGSGRPGASGAAARSGPLGQLLAGRHTRQRGRPDRPRGPCAEPACGRSSADGARSIAAGLLIIMVVLFGTAQAGDLLLSSYPAPGAAGPSSRRRR
jgi:DNA-binding SARP family transcriptional activator